MNGRPVWLASYSLRDSKGIVPAWTFKEKQIVRAEHILQEALEGLGDRTRARFFLMSLTACMHRAVSDDELAELPEGFAESAQVIAGAPAVRIVWETVPGSPSTKPCHEPRRSQMPHDGPRPIWLALDCGKCEPCLARAAC